MDPELFRELPLVVFDLETTGLCRTQKKTTGKPDEIVQICATDLHSNRTFFSYCKPAVRANFAGLYPSREGRRPTAFDVHKIGPEKVRSADTWRAVGPRFARFLEAAARGRPGVVLAAYNGWAFDGPFLASNNEMHEVPRVDAPVYLCDPLRVAKASFSGPAGQADLYRRLFNEDFTGAHDARADVLALARICGHSAIAGRLWEFCKPFEVGPPPPPVPAPVPRPVPRPVPLRARFRRRPRRRRGREGRPLTTAPHAEKR